MGNEFNENDIIKPSLTFEPVFEEDKKEEIKTVEDKKPEEDADESILTPEERKLVDNFVEKIDLKNTNSILQYGVGAQKKIADFSESALNNVKTKDLGEVGNMLTNVVTELKNFENTDEKKGFLSMFKKPVKKIEQMKVK